MNIPRHANGLLAADPFQQQRELIPTQACNDAALAKVQEQRLGDLAQKMIANVVAAELVDLFELIQIQQQDGAFAVVQQRILQGILKIAAIEQLRERVAFC